MWILRPIGWVALVLDRPVTYWQALPRPLRLSAALLVGTMVLVILQASLAGTPKPVMPSAALFQSVDIEQPLTASLPELSSFDFIFRPVFSLTRRPPQRVADKEVKPDTLERGGISAEPKAFEGANLLGIFGSEEVEGAIIRLDNGDPIRLNVGEQLNGWSLQSVSAREIQFVSETGEVADLDMVLSSAQVPIPAASATKVPDTVESQKNKVTTQGDGSADTAAEDERQAATFTFESMYRQRAQQPSDS